MTRRPIYALTLAAVLGGLSLAGVMGVLVAAPARQRPMPPVQLTPTPPDASRPVAALADAACRVAGTPLEIDPGAADTLVARLSNAGEVTATAQALQMGWEGDGQVVEVRLGGTRLFTGSLSSPALVPFPAGVRLAAGQSAELRVRLAGQRPDTATRVVQAVLFMREGCEVVLGPVPPNPCPLAVGPVAPDGAAPTHAGFMLANTGNDTLLLSAIEIAWPEAGNGALTGIWIGGSRVHAFGERAPHSPASIDLRALLDKPLSLGPSARMPIGLEFEKPAAATGYKVTVVTSRGCSASNGAASDDNGCGVQLGGFATRDRSVVLHVTNMRRAPRQLAQLDVFWPSEVNGPLVAVVANGSPVWTGQAARSPTTLRLTGASLSDDLAPGVMIGAGETLELRFVFGPVGGSPGPVLPQPTRRPAAPADQGLPDGIAAGDYTVVAGLRDGCSAVFSTLIGQLDDGCTVSADALEVDPGQGEVRVNLTSTGAQATLRQLGLSWPLRNGALTGVYLGTVQMLPKPQAPQADPFVLDVSGVSATIAPNGSRTLRLTFAGRPAPNGYALDLQFVGPAGQACDQLLVSAPAAPAECRVAFDGLQLLGPDAVSLALRNDGGEAVEMKYLNVDWPDDRPDASLEEIALLRADGSEEVVWSGREKKPPARLQPNGPKPPVLAAGEQARLRLRFDQLGIGLGGEKAFRVTVGFAEGCQAAYAPEGGQILPERVTVSGFIKNIPDAPGAGKRLVGCCWRIQAQDREWIIEIDARTRFDPSSVVPKEGDGVVVQALVFSTGEKARYVAQSITFRTDATPVLLIGPIEKLDDQNDPPQWLVVQGRVITVRDSTVIEGKLQLGAMAQVKGVANDKGGVTAGLIKVESDGEPVLVQGTVQRARQDGSDQLWWVDQYVVRVTPGLDWSGDAPPSSAAVPEPGRQVEIQGVLATSGKREVRARRITFMPVPKLKSLDGVLTDVPAGSQLGTWTIQLASGDEASFVVDAPNVVDSRRAPARRGVKVHAVVEEQQGVDALNAVSVNLDWPD